MSITGNGLANKIIGSEQDDTIDGGGAADTILGGKGNDKIYGGTGNDCLKGGDGDDILIGGKGNDTLYGGAGDDVFVYNKGDDNDKIMNYADGDIVSITGDRVTNITSSQNNITLNLAGKKKITLESAAYEIITYEDSKGEHTYSHFVNFSNNGKVATLKESYAKETFDLTNYSKYADVLSTINASAVQHSMNIVGNGIANYITGTSDDDTIDGGKGKDTVYGGVGNDLLYGGDGNDYIYGGEGADTITGGKSNDKLWGGEGDDVFIYSKGDGVDTIFDYDSSVDKIVVMSGKVGNVALDKNNNLVFEIEGNGKIILSEYGNNYAEIVDSSGTIIKQYKK